MNGYGWLNKRVFQSLHGYAGGDGSAVVAYEYGWPSGGTEESDVVMQYLFDETSGNITDEVTSTVLSVTGVVTYEIAAAAPWEGVSTGIEMQANDDFGTGSPDASWAPGTSDFTIEFVSDASGGNDALWYALSGYQAAATTNGVAIALGYSNVPNAIGYTLIATDGTTAGATIDIDNTDMNDDEIHKYRTTYDRSGNAECFVDGISEGSWAITAIDGKTVDFPSFYVGSLEGVARNGGTMYEVRISHNLTNNSGGPGGG